MSQNRRLLIIDRIERDAAKELGLFLVIHMDPLETEDQTVLKVRKKTEKAVEELDSRCSIHDFRMVKGEDQTNLIFGSIRSRMYSSHLPP